MFWEATTSLSWQQTTSTQVGLRSVVTADDDMHICKHYGLNSTAQTASLQCPCPSAVQLHCTLLHCLCADCCFIEDTAVVVGRTAIIARIGAASRQGEEAPVAAALQDLGYSLQVRRRDPHAGLNMPLSRIIIRITCAALQGHKSISCHDSTQTVQP